MPKYIFTHDARDSSFPERFRVVSIDDDAELLRDTENLTGTILDTEAIEFLEELMSRYQSDELLITEMVDAPSWEFIVDRFKPGEIDEDETSETSQKPPLIL